MIFMEDADGQLVNLAHVARIWASEKSDGTCAVMAEEVGLSGLRCLRRGFESEAAARDWMVSAIPGVLRIL